MLGITPTMLSQDVRLSVRPSVTRRLCVQTAKHIIRLCSLSGNHAILVFFRTKRYDNISTGPPNRGVECRGYEKSQFLMEIYCFISEMIQYMAIVSTEL